MTINYNVEYIAVLIADLLLLIFDEPFIVVIRNTYHYILYRTVVSEEDFNFNCSTKVSILRNRLGDIKAYLINNKLWIAVDYDYNNGYKIVTNYVTHIHTRKKI